MLFLWGFENELRFDCVQTNQFELTFESPSMDASSMWGAPATIKGSVCVGTEADRWWRTDFEVPIWSTPLPVPWQRSILIPLKADSRFSGECPATTRCVADGCGASLLEKSHGIMAQRG